MKPTRKRRFASIGAAVLLLGLVLAVLFLTVPEVAHAVRSLFGYIPGVGRVEQGALLRVLAAPVSDTRAGYTVTVERALLDATRTVIHYRAVGAFPRWDDPTLRPSMCDDLPVLLLPNGARLAHPSGEGGSNGAESTWTLVYGALPEHVDRARLVFPCLPGLPAGEGPRDWEFTLAFAPAPTTLTVYPVVDLPTPTLSSRPAPVEPQAAAVADLHGIRWTVNGMAVLSDGYYLETTLAWPAGLDAGEVQVYPDALRLTDAAGQEAAVWQAGGAPFAPAETGTMPLHVQTSALSSPGPARLTLDYLALSRSASAQFRFDVGSQPQPGQVWPINQDLALDGHHLRVLSAKYVETPPGAPAMLVVDLESDSGIIAVIASDLEHERLDSGGRPASDQGPMQAGWHYRGAFPRGTITVTVSMITERVDGPWILEWDPPAGTVPPAPALPTAMPTLPAGSALCQPEAQMQDDLPEGLGGRVASAKWTGERWELLVSNLDGSAEIALGPGAFPNLSADGQKVVYRGADEGTYVRDLTSGEVRMLPGSQHPGVYDNLPVWSPDGRQIAFYRNTGDHVFDLYVMDADGGKLRAVTSGPEIEMLMGWNANGSGLYYQSVGIDGPSVRMLDLETGRSSEITRLPEGTFTASLSPDASRLVYLTEQAIWLDRLDGSPAEALLATHGQFAGQIHPQWSPDGRWLTINFAEPSNASQPHLALLEVDGCRWVRLNRHPGIWISSWVE